MKKKTKVVHMVTASTSVGLMKGQLSYLVNLGFDVTIISSSGKELEGVRVKENVNIKAINMERSISILRDLVSLIKIIFYFLKLKPSICNAGTPKAGLLGMLGAWLTRVPFKVYTIRGLPFETASGLQKRILIFTEKIACFCADKVICISPSLEKKVIDYQLTSKKKTIVFGHGSSNGIQIDKFIKTLEVQKQVERIKIEKKLNNYKLVIGYVGRINRSKGINELVKAFENLQKKYDNIALIMIGAKEEKDSISKETYLKVSKNPHIKEIGKVKDPIPYYFIMDVLAFPTHREGFGNVSIEAQATGTPVVTTNATGAVDTVINNETGLIVDIEDEIALERNLERFIINPNLVKELGMNGLQRVERDFDSMIIWSSLEKLYKSSLNNRYN
ncbi:glycosyltransferase family 4 protein [Virgibacillus oceani]